MKRTKRWWARARRKYNRERRDGEHTLSWTRWRTLLPISKVMQHRLLERVLHDALFPQILMRAGEQP